MCFLPHRTYSGAGIQERGTRARRIGVSCSIAEHRSRPRRRTASCRARPGPLAARTHPAETGVVHFHPARQRLVPLAPSHLRYDFPLHRPGRQLPDPKPAPQFHRRDAVLRRRDQVDGRKPHRQRQLGRVEDRPCRRRGLFLAGVALIRRTARWKAVPVMTARRADEAVAPAQSRQRGSALLLGAEQLAKRSVTQTPYPRGNPEPHRRGLPFLQTYEKYRRSRVDSHG